MTAFHRVIEAFRNQGLNVDEKSHDQALCQAPGHSHVDRSVLVSYNGDQALIYSYANEDTGDILDAIGLHYRDLYDSDQGVKYEYPDGRTVHRSVLKEFRQAGNTKGDQLYRIEFGGNETVYVVGGEKDVHTLEYNGFAATCNPGGEGNVGNFDLSPLLGLDVVVVRDNDDTGVKFANILVDKLAPFTPVKVVTAKIGKDATDHFSAGLGVDDFQPDPQFDTPIMLAKLKASLDGLKTLSPEKAALRIRTLTDAAIPHTGPGDLINFDDLVQEWLDHYEKSDDESLPLSSPWPEIDDLLGGGFYRGALHLVAARPGKGKSLLLTNFAEHATQAGRRGALFSVEMSRVEVMSRIIAAATSTDHSRIKRREMDGNDMTRVGEWIDASQGLPLFVCDRGSVTVRKIAQDCRKLSESGGLDFLAVDYLQLLSSDSGRSRQEQISEISRELKVLAMELDIAVVAACQLNRKNEHDNRPPKVSDLRESGSLEQDADAVLLLHHEELDGMKTGDVNVIVGKSRNGKPDVTVPLLWRPWYSRIG